MAAKIKADTSPLAVQVKRFCAGKGDECLVDQTLAAFEVNDLMQAYAAGSPEYTALSSCFDRFGNSDGGGDYVRTIRCATGDMVARESSGNENLSNRRVNKKGVSLGQMSPSIESTSWPNSFLMVIRKAS
ncbi:MAG: hypothetical protein IH978_06505 [Nitrospinae bacterium]|nr:hypothetical protein [Nitrospinota bacterium]